MSEWKEYKLNDVIEKFIDYRGKTPTKTTSGIPLITAKIVKGGRILEPQEFIAVADYTNWMTRGYPEINDVVLTTEAPLGEVALLKNKNVALAQRIITLRGKTQLCNNVFLKYYFQSSVGQHLLHSRAQGTTVEGIKSSELKEIEISLPSVNIQKSIGNLLLSLDDKVDLLQRQNKKLEELAETLFMQWFIEEVEEDTEEQRLDAYIEFDPREKMDRSKPCRFFDMKCLSSDGMTILEGITRVVASASSFRNNDTLLAKITPCLENGKTGFVMHLDDNEIARGSTEFIVMRSKGFVSPYWIYCLARTNNFRERAIASMNGTSGRQRVQMDLLKSIEINMNTGRMAEFHSTVHAFFKKIKSNSGQIQTLTKLRENLLPKLMSGEIKIKTQ